MEPGSFLFNESFTCRGKGNMLVLHDTDSLLRGARRSFMGLGESESSRKRPFFRSLEEMFSDEFYDGQSPEKKRRLSADQVCLLEKAFEAEIKLEPERKKELAKKMGLPPRQIAIWFQNRRARWRTKQLEQGYDHLKSSYESLLIKFDSILKDNEKLRSQVTSLNERLHHVISPTEEEAPPIKAEEAGHSTGSDIVDEESLWPVADVCECDIIDMVRAESHGSGNDDPGWCCECEVFGGQQEPTIGWWAWHI